MLELLNRNLKDKSFLVGVFINSIFATLSFLSFSFLQGRTYLSQIFSPEQFNTLINSNVSFVYYIFLPILLCVPASVILFKDKKSGMDINYINRMGRKKYYSGRYISIFISTVIAMTLPFLIEYLLAVLIFKPNNYSGFLDHQNFYSSISLQNFSSLALYKLYYLNRHLYVCISIIVNGVVSGLFAVFTASFITLNFKYAVLYFLPSYIYIFAIQRLLSYNFYIRLFNMFSFIQESMSNILLVLVPLFIIIILNYLISINPKRVLVYEES